MTILDAARKARSPWESPESISDVGLRSCGTLSVAFVVTADTPEQVQGCLNCTKPVCNNCLEEETRRTAFRAQISGQEKMEGF